jgi:hypothetical protein
MRGIGEGWDDAAGLGQRGGEDACYVRFNVHPKEDTAASAKEGRPIYRETEYVEIMVAGDKQNVVHRPVTEKDKKRFRRQYEDWKRNGDSSIVEGTPLDQWPAVSRSQVEELRYFNVRTVEQLAALSDGNAAKIGPVMALKQKAADFLGAAKNSSHLTTLRAELSAKDNQISTMAAQIAALQETVDAIRSERGDDKPRRGRPPKSDLES